MRRSACLPSLALLASLGPVPALAAPAPEALEQPSGGVSGGMVPVRINEIRIDQPGPFNTNEYFELTGPPGTSLDGLSYLVIGDGPGGNDGVVETVVSLSGQVIAPSGFFLVAHAAFGLAPPDLVAGFTFEDRDTVTHLLVVGFAAGAGTDLDLDDDGVLDLTPWAQLVDLVAVEGASADLAYGPGSACLAGPACQAVVDPEDPHHL